MVIKRLLLCYVIERSERTLNRFAHVVVLEFPTLPKGITWYSLAKSAYLSQVAYFLLLALVVALIILGCVFLGYSNKW